jgi:hypothetical protein
MATIIIFFSVLGVSAGVYGIVSTIKAHRQQKKKEKSKYHNKVQEYTIERGYSISNNYNDLEKRLANGEQLKPVRNPMDNQTYREIKTFFPRYVVSSSSSSSSSFEDNQKN